MDNQSVLSYEGEPTHRITTALAKIAARPQFLPTGDIEFVGVEDDRPTEEEIQILSTSDDLTLKIILALELAMVCASVTPDGKVETSEGRKRSALDLARLLRHYDGKTTLWEVMDCLHKNIGNIYSMFCFGIYKRVFQTLENAKHGWYSYDSIETLKQPRSPERVDELGLTFEEWRN